MRNCTYIGTWIVGLNICSAYWIVTSSDQGLNFHALNITAPVLSNVWSDLIVEKFSCIYIDL